jgi:hypothetical protein
MTQRLDALQFLRAGRAVAVIGLAMLPAAVAGCASTGLDDLVPTTSTASQSTLPESAPRPTGVQRGTATASSATANGALAAPVETVAAPSEPLLSNGPKNSGTFPNLNIPPQVANTQITDDEKAAETQSLRATQAGVAASAPGVGKVTTDAVLLRKLAAKHAGDALKKIEGQ